MLNNKHDSTDEKDEKDFEILTLLHLAHLVHESKKHGARHEDVVKAILKQRWSMEILHHSACLDENQIVEVVYKTAQDLNLKQGKSLWIPEEDLAFVFELYAALHYCPTDSIEPAMLSVFFESILTKENLNTIVAATFHNIQPRAGDNIKDFTAINMWFDRLDERYNFSLGPAILPMLTSDQLTQLAELDPPYMKENQDHQYENLSSPFGKNAFCGTCI